jgi:HEPN domain-containing protein
MLTDDERIEPEILAFHSQQAAEKALKAVLVLQQIDFPRTHDLGLLLEMCSAAGCTETETLQPATGLTRYAVATRYPGDHERLSRDDAHVAGELAAGVLAWAEARIA